MSGLLLLGSLFIPVPMTFQSLIWASIVSAVLYCAFLYLDFGIKYALVVREEKEEETNFDQDEFSD